MTELCKHSVQEWEQGGGNVPLVLIVTESHYDDWHEDDISNTLRASGATQGGRTSSHCKYRGPEL